MSAKHQSGFTLIELMVAVTIVAILMVLATPSFVEYFERYRLRSAVEDTLAVFAQARQGAVESDRNVRLKVGGTTGAWCVGAVQASEPATAGELVSVTPAACNCDTAPATCLVGGEQLVVDRTGRSGVSLSAVTTDFTYDSKGGTLVNLASTPQIDFISSSGRYGLSLRVSALGQARACNSAGMRQIPGFSPCP